MEIQDRLYGRLGTIIDWEFSAYQTIVKIQWQDYDLATYHDITEIIAINPINQLTLDIFLAKYF